jgi:hypothetical protein
LLIVDQDELILLKFKPIELDCIVVHQAPDEIIHVITIFGFINFFINICPTNIVPHLSVSALYVNKLFISSDHCNKVQLYANCKFFTKSICHVSVHK